MLKLRPSFRKAAVGALAALTLAGSLAATTVSADARPWHHFHHHHHGFGPALAAGVIGGLALGALAARPYYYYAEPPYYVRCWTERHRVIDPWGDVVWRRVRVCD